MPAAAPFEVRFWGVRGSIPTPGHSTARVGGNTSCVEIRVAGEEIILDAGSGVRELGARLSSEKVRKATFLFSHVHWDHILGFPYFRPAAEKGNELTIFGERKGGAGIDEILAYQAEQSHRPLVTPGKGARIRFEDVTPGDSFRLGAVSVSSARMNHPDGCVAFRIEYGGRSVVYATDTEHYDSQSDPELTRLCQGADALIYDAMYTAQEYRGEVGGSKKGWGHSTWEDGLRVVEAAGVKRFVLFHHEPAHDDGFVEKLERECAAAFPASVAAREGLVLDLAADRVRAPRKAAKPARRRSATR